MHRSLRPLFLWDALPLAGHGQVVSDLVGSPPVEHHRLGDNPVRPILGHLAPSYAGEPTRRYPTLYPLHGFGGAPASGVDGSYPGPSTSLNLEPEGM